MKLMILKIKALVKLLFFILLESNKIKKAEVLFFFPYYHTGGAEKVHLDIVNTVKDKKVYVFFTDKSSSEKYHSKFQEIGPTYAVFEFLNRAYIVKDLFTYFIAKRIQHSPNLKTIFACNSMYFYELLPKLNTKAQVVDLFHAFSKPDYGLEIFSLPVVPKIHARIVINQKGLADFTELYTQQNLLQFIDRVKVIPIVLNQVEAELPPKSQPNFRVAFVGRWAKEKRPELFIDIAQKVKELSLEVQFVMAGPDMQVDIINTANANILCMGEILEEEELSKLYETLDVLLITSYREGFPVVIMEAMRKGVIPVAINVGGIPEHIFPNENGFLVDNAMQYDKIVNAFVELIVYLYQHKTEKDMLRKKVHAYALDNFAPNVFVEKYREILLN